MKKIALLLLTALIVINAYAQKLPNVQQVSLRAPANVKIDGKATEWGDRFEAYNNGTEIYYSLANNKEYLYLVVQVTDAEIIDKILASGLTFTVNTNGNRKDRTGVMITYPAFAQGSKREYFGLYKMKEIKRDKQNAAIRADSLINASNNLIKSKFKLIGVSGLKPVTDDRIPIYNEEGIMAAGMFDNNLCYSFELAISLKLLNGTNKFSYNIQLNGYAYNGTNLEAVRDRFLGYIGADGQRYMLGEPTPRNWSLATPSSFWGDYTLAN